MTFLIWGVAILLIMGVIELVIHLRTWINEKE